VRSSQRRPRGGAVPAGIQVSGSSAETARWCGLWSSSKSFVRRDWQLSERHAASECISEDGGIVTNDTVLPAGTACPFTVRACGDCAVGVKTHRHWCSVGVVACQGYERAPAAVPGGGTINSKSVVHVPVPASARGCGLRERHIKDGAGQSQCPLAVPRAQSVQSLLLTVMFSF
jgi:hypothetical protein